MINLDLWFLELINSTDKSFEIVFILPADGLAPIKVYGNKLAGMFLNLRDITMFLAVTHPPWKARKVFLK